MSVVLRTVRGRRGNVKRGRAREPARHAAAWRAATAAVPAAARGRLCPLGTRALMAAVASPLAARVAVAIRPARGRGAARVRGLLQRGARGIRARLVGDVAEPRGGSLRARRGPAVLGMRRDRAIERGGPLGPGRSRRWRAQRGSPVPSRRALVAGLLARMVDPGERLGEHQREPVGRRARRPGDPRPAPGPCRRACR